MKLLILGAGSHGKDVAEIAEDIGYDEIAFLDDNKPEAIGKIDEMEKFRGEYDNAFVGIGSNSLRLELMKKLYECGYTVPNIIHPSAYVSRTAIIGAGTVIEPKAVLNARCHIGDGCIISTGAIVEHDAWIGEYCNIKSGAIVKAGWKIEGSRKIEGVSNIQEYEPEAEKVKKYNDTFAKEYKEMTGREASFF